MLQNWIVGVIVLLAALYSLWYALPTALRQRLGRMHPALGPGKPCSTCNSCGGCAAGAKPKDLPPSQPTQQVIKFYRATPEAADGQRLACQRLGKIGESLLMPQEVSGTGPSGS
jgi:hypothetical protein